MTIRPNPDNVGPEAYARRIEAGDEILYIKEAAAFVRKSGHDALLPAHRHRTPQLPPRTQCRLLEDRPDPLARRGEQPALRA
ncbi:MAG: hypothetical protein ACSLEW_09120 [Nocardioides sp.]